MSAFCREQFGRYAVIIFTNEKLPLMLKKAFKTFNYDAPYLIQSWVGLISQVRSIVIIPTPFFLSNRMHKRALQGMVYAA